MSADGRFQLGSVLQSDYALHCSPSAAAAAITSTTRFISVSARHSPEQSPLRERKISTESDTHKMDAMQPQVVYPLQGLTDPSASAADSTPAMKTKEVAPFLKNLRQILECESESILRWTDDGRAFEIHDMQQMMDYVLPKYFKHAKYTSFQRQLNYFNFRKWTKSKAKVCTFSNPHFVRDQPCLSWRINRKKSTHSSSNSNSLKPHSSSRASTRKQTECFEEQFGVREMTIKLPTKVASPSSSSFPSPTEVYGADGDLDLQRMYDDMTAGICFHEPIVIDGQSLDWVDTLYSSLDGVSKIEDSLPSFYDHTFDYHV